MARDRKHRRSGEKGGRVTPKGTRPAGWYAPPPERHSSPPPDLLRDLRRAIDSGHPLDLLFSASQLMELVTERLNDRYASIDKHLDRNQLFGSFLEVDLPETTAVLSALALFAADVERRRIRNELARRSHDLPAWVSVLDQAEITGVWEMTEHVRDGDNHLLGVRWPTGHELSFVVYVDHNMGTIVKDAFPVAAPPSEVLQTMAKHGDPTVVHRSLDPATARARIVEAIEQGERTIPPVENETWPGCRSLVEWAAGLLPSGGTGYQWREWSDAEREALIDDFLASPEASPLRGDDELRELVDPLVWFGCDYSFAGPLLLSGVRAEILLVDWLPRKIVGDASFLARIPGVLRAFIAYGHRVSGVAPETTTDALAAVDHYEPEYQRLIRSPRAQGAEALALAAARLAAGGPFALDDDEDDDHWDDDDWDDEDHAAWLAGYRHEVLVAIAGSEAALAALDAVPLPDEPFDWASVPDDIRPRVTAALELLDRCCDEVLGDVEYRTVCRRLLSRAAAADPGLFRRRARDEVTAGGVAWLAGKANGLFRSMMVKELAAWFGATSGAVSQKGGTILTKLGITGAHFAYDGAVGDPTLLTSARRAALIKLRDGGW